MLPQPRILALLLCLPVAGAAMPAVAGDLVAGPVAARLLRVIDGDTIEAEALIWPGHSVKVAIRIRGIDAPELRGGCEAEKVAALAARDMLARFLAAGTLEVRNIGADKYFGRVVADIAAPDGADIGGLLLAHEVARAYDGGGRQSFCSS